MLVLIVQTGKYKGKRLKVVDSELLIGRDEDAAIRISSNEVSRQHCLLTVIDGGLTVRDLGSRNGTFVDGAPIGQSEQADLLPGGTLTVGPMTFQLVDTSTDPKTEQPAAAPEKASSLSDDDIATWLTESDTSEHPTTGDTTIITGRDAPADANAPIQPPLKKEPKREFASVAEEAADIIRRHKLMVSARDSQSDVRALEDEESEPESEA